MSSLARAGTGWTSPDWSTTFAQVRQHLLQLAGSGRTALVSLPTWRHGVADHPPTGWTNDTRHRVDELIDRYRASLHDCLEDLSEEEARANPSSRTQRSSAWSST